MEIEIRALFPYISSAFFPKHNGKLNVDSVFLFRQVFWLVLFCVLPVTLYALQWQMQQNYSMDLQQRELLRILTGFPFQLRYIGVPKRCKGKRFYLKLKKIVPMPQLSRFCIQPLRNRRKEVSHLFGNAVKQIHVPHRFGFLVMC
jgi:hypothetical protein